MTRERRKTRRQSRPAMHEGDPCEKCGYTWYLLALDFSDPEAEELATYAVCVRCRHAPNRPTHQVGR